MSHRLFSFSTSWASLATGWTLILAGGCQNTTQLVAKTTVDLFAQSAPAFQEYWDYDLAGEAVPATLVQLEGILRVVPENPKLLTQLTNAYVGYAYGWLEAEIEAIEFTGKDSTADKKRKRVRLMYLRAKNLALDRIRLHNKKVDKLLQGPVEDLEAWLRKAFKNKADAEMLLWLGYAWGSYINASKADIEAVINLPYAIAFVQRSVELDPMYYNAAGYTFLAVAEASALSPDMKKAKSYFDTALNLTNREALIILVNMARTYAVKTADRKLFTKLLNEVLNAGDTLPTARLSNRIARVRAQLYIDNANQLFQ